MINAAIKTDNYAICPMIRCHSVRILASIALAVLLGACNTINPNATPMFPSRVPLDNNLPTMSVGVSNLAVPTLAPVFVLPTAIPPTFPNLINPPPVPPTPIPVLDNNWNQMIGGIQWRILTYNNQSNGQLVSVLVARIDPTKVQFRVQYSQGKGKLLRDWQTALPSAVAIINGNYFDAGGNAIGLVAVDGTVYSPYFPRADSGVFQVQGGVPKVRSFFLEAYNASEHFDEAVQGVPMLMTIGYVAPKFEPGLDATANSRTVIAQDKLGRILFIVTQYSTTTFTDLAHWLGVSGLDISSAVNMDGGNSSNLYLATGGPSQFTQTAALLPVVVAVIPR